MKSEDILNLMGIIASVEVNAAKCDKIGKWEYGNYLINTNWDEINQERQAIGLSKLSNNDMKSAWIKEKIKPITKAQIHINKELMYLYRLYENREVLDFPEGTDTHAMNKVGEVNTIIDDYFMLKENSVDSEEEVPAEIMNGNGDNDGFLE